ncbi:hypothetical protein [Streptomyces sp. NPDC058623]|uniref:hypothetical protein n=1 Tax=Streptomyces sp. NPDC058623 TaxID=3346563 RepID=UPI0036467F2B
MNFSWRIPPWERFEDCTFLAVTLTDSGDGQYGHVAEGVRGDDPIEALADLLMTPGSLLGLMPSYPGLIGVVVKRGIDSTWLAKPPVQVGRDERGRWQVGIAQTDLPGVTVFTPTEISGLVSRLQSQYGRRSR